MIFLMLIKRRVVLLAGLGLLIILIFHLACSLLLLLPFLIGLGAVLAATLRFLHVYLIQGRIQKNILPLGRALPFRGWRLALGGRAHGSRLMTLPLRGVGGVVVHLALLLALDCVVLAL